MFVYTWMSGDFNYCKVRLGEQAIENTFYCSIFKMSLCEGGLIQLHRSPAIRRRRRKGNPAGGHKFRDLVLQIGGWIQG